MNKPGVADMPLVRCWFHLAFARFVFGHLMHAHSKLGDWIHARLMHAHSMLGDWIEARLMLGDWIDARLMHAHSLLGQLGTHLVQASSGRSPKKLPSSP